MNTAVWYLMFMLVVLLWTGQYVCYVALALSPVKISLNSVYTCDIFLVFTLAIASLLTPVEHALHAYARSRAPSEDACNVMLGLMLMPQVKTTLYVYRTFPASLSTWLKTGVLQMTWWLLPLRFKISSFSTNGAPMMCKLATSVWRYAAKS